MVLGFDMAYATLAMSRFNMLPRKGHLKAITRILSYLETFLKRRIILGTTHHDNSAYHIEDHSNLREFHPVAEEEIRNDLSTTRRSKLG
jgi:hypothetical protein